MTEPVIFPPRTAAILDVLAALVGFDTTSSKTNLPLLDYVEDHLARHGVASTRVHSSPDKANLWATIGPADVPGVVLSGHVDVVPVDGQAWTRPPFRLTIEGSRAYGRGTTDMKGFVATCLAMVRRCSRRA